MAMFLARLPVYLLLLSAPTVVCAREIRILPTVPYDNVIDSVRALGRGDTLTFAAGTFTLPGPIHLRGHTLVRGTLKGGTRVSILRRHPGFHGPYDAEKPRWCWDENQNAWIPQRNGHVETLIGGCTGPAYLDSLTLQDLRIEGLPDDADIPVPENAFDLVRMAGNRVTIRRCEMRHSRNGGILLFGGEGNRIENCVVENTARDGIFVSGTKGIVVKGNTVRATRDNAIAFDCQNVAIGAKAGRLNFVDCGDASFITGNTIDNDRKNPLYRYKTDGAVAGYNHYGWTSQTDRDPRAYASGGIYAGRPHAETDTNGVPAMVRGLTIEGNTVKGAWLFGIRLDNGCENILIRNNTVSAPDVRLYALGLDADDGARYPRNIRIVGNTLSTKTAPRVLLKKNREVWFAGNRVPGGKDGRLRMDQVAGRWDGCRQEEIPRARIHGNNVDGYCQ